MDNINIFDNDVIKCISNNKKTDERFITSLFLYYGSIDDSKIGVNSNVGLKMCESTLELHNYYYDCDYTDSCYNLMKSDIIKSAINIITAA